VADQHTVRAFDKDLELLERRIAEMGGIAEKMVIEAVDALSSGDSALAHQVVETDARLDTLQREIEEQATLTIARRQPVASDLREGKATLAVIHAYERATLDEQRKVQKVLDDRALNGVTHGDILAILNRYGSLEFANSMAAEYSEAARKDLEQFPENEFKRALLWIPDFVVAREK